jgi:hypothetical protein
MLQKRDAEKKGVVVFLDSVGTKGVWRRKSPKETFNSMEEIKELVEEYLSIAEWEISYEKKKKFKWEK